jgi:hypothetical protein
LITNGLNWEWVRTENNSKCGGIAFHGKFNLERKKTIATIFNWV